MTEARVPVEKRMRLRYAGHCRMCETELPAKSDAIYERASKTVRCVTCVSVPEVVAEERDWASEEPWWEVDPWGAGRLG
ncbi:MAG TPA: hypothetical protein VFX52_03935 [Nocardioidaceae bacterium]|nr:hypothetical protein [Nocardioidaceae bacterium]